MRKIEHEGFDHLVSVDWEEPYRFLPSDTVRIISESRLDLFTKQSLFAEVINAWGKIKGLHRNLMLESHGYVREGIWVLSMEGTHKPAQQWIDENDGEYAALIIFACNPNNNEITSAESAVLHANRNFSIYSSNAYSTPLARLYIPGEGYLEKSKERLRGLVEMGK